MIEHEVQAKVEFSSWVLLDKAKRVRGVGRKAELERKAVEIRFHEGQETELKLARCSVSFSLEETEPVCGHPKYGPEGVCVEDGCWNYSSKYDVASPEYRR